MNSDTAFGQMQWGRILSRGGFQILFTGNGFDFSEETPENIRFFRAILREAAPQEAKNFDGVIFTPSEPTMNEIQWLDTIRRIRRRSEGEDFSESVKLEFLDPYMAGIVRWLNAAGIPTSGSCDGDGKPGKKPYLSLDGRTHQRLFDYIVRAATQGERNFGPKYFKFPDRRQPIEELQELIDVSWLLDVAERLYYCHKSLGQVISVLETEEYTETCAAIAEGLAELESGLGIPLEDYEAEVRAR